MLTIQARVLRRQIETLSAFGRPARGTFADGVTRIGYSDADLAARRCVQDLMREAGLNPRIDPAGNISGRREGTDPTLPVILFGSHVDSVPNGGNFDGCLGTVAAIEVMRALVERGVRTRHPLEAVVWANEEGVAYGRGMCGSRAATGQLVEDELDQVWHGVSHADAIRKIGGDPARIGEARRPPESIHCYLELHIEQGTALEAAVASIGVVEGIVAIDRYEVTVSGCANNAGTATMTERQDALLAAAQIVVAVHDIVMQEPGRQVGTVGELVVNPNVPNVVPAHVRHTIELRDLSSEKIRRLARQIESRAAAIATATRTSIDIRPISHQDAALAAPQVQQAIERACARLHLSTLRVASGAGHDAQTLAMLAPVGMIFVPSVGGISHSSREFTRWEDCASGATVLGQTILATDRMVFAPRSVSEKREHAPSRPASPAENGRNLMRPRA